MASISSISAVAAADAQQFTAVHQALKPNKSAQATPGTADPSKIAGASPGAIQLNQGRAVAAAQTANAVTAPGKTDRLADDNPALDGSTRKGDDNPGMKLKAEIARQTRIEVRSAIESAFLQSMFESANAASRDDAMASGDQIARDRMTLASMEMPEASRVFRAEQEMSTRRFEAQLAEVRSLLMDRNAGASTGIDMRA